MAEQMYFDCPTCGEIGLIQKLKDHSTRPMPCDLGFCPKCGGEIDEFLNERSIRKVIEGYDEDADKFLEKLK